MLLMLLMLMGPPEARAAYERGVALMERGQVAEAVEALERAAGLEGKNAQYWKTLGTAHARLGDYGAAIPALKRACGLQPALVDACYYLGRALYAADRYEEAVGPLETALRVDGVKGRAETGLGQAREALGEAEEAERRFRGAVGRRDGFVEQARLAYGLFLIRQGRAAEALEPLRAAGGTGEALYRLGWALAECGRVEEGLAELKRALAVEPGHAAAGLLAEKLNRRLSAAPSGGAPGRP